MRILIVMSCLTASVSWAAQSSTSTSAGGTGPVFRIFAGATSAKPDQVNPSFESQGLQKVSASLLVGGEFGYAFNKFGLGLRYMSNQVSRSEDPDIPNSDHTGYLSQSILMAMGHVPIINKDIIKFELFAGLGSANTHLKVTSATQAGELNKGMFNGTVSTGGAALSLGYKSVFLIFEGGYMDNKSSGFARTGTIDSSIQTINLSGTFATVGILFYGNGAGDFFNWFGRNTGMAK